MRDYHIHTDLCKHAQRPLEEYVAQAVKLGLEEICITDHIPLPGGFDSTHRMEPRQMDLYLEMIETCKQKYPQISILTGIEADYIEGYEAYLEAFLKEYSFDIVIMAIHFIKKWPDGNWVFRFDFPGKPMAEIYGDYFEAMNKGICTGLFDVVGHMDLIKRPGFPILETNARDIHEVFKNILKHDMALEINTSGLRKDIAEPFPSPTLIRLAVAAGIPLTLGSDAHLPHQVAYNFTRIHKELAGLENVKLKQLGK